MTKDDLTKIAALADSGELGDLLKELAQQSHMAAAAQAAYHQGQADAFRAIYDTLCGQAPVQNDPAAKQQKETV